jgi:protein O-GlcNAc transferase
MDEIEYQNQCDLAQQQLSRGDWALAIQSAHQACSRVPGQGRAYRLIAAGLSAKQDWLSALETYELSWLLEPSNPEAVNGVLFSVRQLRNSPELTEVARPLKELASFGYYSKACRRFMRVNLLDAAGRAIELATGETSDILLQSARMNIDAGQCQWKHFPEYLHFFSQYAHSQLPLPSAAPLLAMCLLDDPAMHLAITQKFVNDHTGHQAVISRKLRPVGKLTRRPRVGYLSADFHDHATSRLMVGMLEQHNRSAWDVVGLSYGIDDFSALRQRTVAAFETFIDLRSKTVEANLQTLRTLNLDILVDAKGLTNEFEASYSFSRPAPVVVNFLAYPGSMGSAAYDYIIGDRVVTPFEHQPHFTECLVQMPHAYQCNDSNRGLPPQGITRSEAGLPDNSIVLAAFNQTKKITPDHFQMWMRILNQSPHAVLWLFSPDDSAKRNLLASAEHSGVAPDRLVFAPSLPQSQHMARHRLADLFLDTFPYNAHTTASDALWMGLPVVTLKGQSFASRVAASLLQVLGLPDLIANTPAAYEQRVVELTRQPQYLAAYRVRLEQMRMDSALFNARRYTQNMEQAYAFMIERSRKGKPAHAFEVRDCADGGGVRLAGSTLFKSVQSYFKG